MNCYNCNQIIPSHKDRFYAYDHKFCSSQCRIQWVLYEASHEASHQVSHEFPITVTPIVESNTELNSLADNITIRDYINSPSFALNKIAIGIKSSVCLNMFRNIF